MKVRTNLNLLIYVKSMRNIDYLSFQKGLVHLRFQIYIVDNKQKTVKYAVPVEIKDYMKKYPYYYKKPSAFVEENKEDNFSKQGNYSTVNEQLNSLWIPSHILTKQNSYCTKTFQLENWPEEELIQINESCKFICELEDYPISNDIKMFMDCEMMYFDLSESADRGNASFKCVSVFKSQLKIQDVLGNPIHEYVPVIFDEDHFNIVNITFHSLVSDICGNRNSNESKKGDGKKGSDKQTSTKYSLDQKLQDLSKNHQQITYKNLKDLDKFYYYYVQGMRQSYEKLLQFYNQLLQDYVLEKQKKDLDSLWDFQPEQLPDQKYLLIQNQELSNQLNMAEDVENRKEMYSKIYPQITQDLYQKLIYEIIQEITIISNITQTLFQNFIQFFRYGGSFLCRKLLKLYTKAIKNKYSEFITSEVYQKQDLGFHSNRQMLNQHVSLCIERRKQNPKHLKYKNILAVEDVRLFPDIRTIPLIFEEVYVKQSEQYRPSLNYQNNKFHMFVFVHGFQGNASDMKLFKNHISILYPEALLLLSAENEGTKTEEDIFTLGHSLAQEIQTFVQKWAPGATLGRITFVCHSLGGLIARAALPYLNEYADKMFTFISLAVPHLGYSQSDKTLINFGISFLQVWKKSLSLQQLQMQDHKIERETFLYKLSQQPGLTWFQNLVLLSSDQDHYVPYESARIEKIEAGDNKFLQIYNEMVDNIFKDSKNSKVHKLDINFESEEKGLDTLIGRKAHIQFLEQQCLIRQLLYNFDHFFK